MTTYQFEISLIMGLAALLLWQYPSKLNKKIYCIIITFQWIFLSGLRHLSVGADTINYYNIYKRTSLTSWKNTFKKFIDIYFKDMEGKDPGYTLFEKITQIITGNNYQVYLVLIALLFFIPFGIWIYKNSKEPCISALIFSCLFWAFFGITGHRQTIATTLVLLIGYKFIKERKLWPFLFLCIIAGTIHKSSFFFLPFYFFAYKKITRNYLICLFITIPILFVFREQFMELLRFVTGYEGYAYREESGAYNFTIVLIGVFIVSLWRMKPILDKNPEAVMYFNALIIAVLFTPLLFINESTMRVVQYYSFFILLLIPEILFSFDGQERVICYSVATGVLLTLFFKNPKYYLFFWQ